LLEAKDKKVDYPNENVLIVQAKKVKYGKPSKEGTLVVTWGLL